MADAKAMQRRPLNQTGASPVRDWLTTGFRSARPVPIPDPASGFLVRVVWSCCLILLLNWALPGNASAQTPGQKTAAAAATAAVSQASAPPTPAPTPIPVADVAVQSETALSFVRQIESDNRLTDSAESAAPVLQRMIQAAAVRSAEMRRLLTRNASLETIRGLVEEWRDIEFRASALTRDLTGDAIQLERYLARLNELEATWQTTSEAAAAASAPPEVLSRIREVLSGMAAARSAVLERRSRVLALQSQAAALDAQASAARQALADATEQATARLLHADSPAVWSEAFRANAARVPLSEADANIATQLRALTHYVNGHRLSILLHATFFVALVGLMRAARRRIREICLLDMDLRRASKVFEMPVVSALLIALLVSNWFYERPPRIVWNLLSVIGTIPTLLFARRVIEPYLHPVLYGLIGFYLLDKFRLIVGPLPIVSRGLFIAEALLALVFILWMLSRTRRPGDVSWTASTSWRVVRAGARAAFVLVSAATLANAAGYVRLSEFLGGASLASAYAAVVLYALTRVVEGLIQGVLHIPPMSRWQIVQRHRARMAHQAGRLIKRLALVAWLVLTLRMLGLLDVALGGLQSAWNASASIGSLTLSIGDVLTLAFILWAAALLSRLVRFVLHEQIFPKLNLDRGLPYAVSTIAHYAILVTGIVLALGAIGVDMTKFTILAGALTVGIGFGLQNIVNNFVSGLIVLFERPVKVGDTIQLDDITGRVERIGIRASTVHSSTGANIVVPNGKLISDKLINWTMLDRLRQITVPVLTKPDIDIGQAEALLVRMAAAHPLVLSQPAPEVLFTRRAMDVFEFELRIWTDAPDQWQRIRSSLMKDIDRELRHLVPEPAPDPPHGHQLPLDFGAVDPHEQSRR